MPTHTGGFIYIRVLYSEPLSSYDILTTFMWILWSSSSSIDVYDTLGLFRFPKSCRCFYYLGHITSARPIRIYAVISATRIFITLYVTKAYLICPKADACYLCSSCKPLFILRTEYSFIMFYEEDTYFLCRRNGLTYYAPRGRCVLCP